MTINEIKQQLAALDAEQMEYAEEQYRYGRIFPRMEQARIYEERLRLTRELIFAQIESGEYIPAKEISRANMRQLQEKYGVLLHFSKDEDGVTYCGLI